MICRDCKAFVPDIIVLYHGGVSQCMPCHQLFKFRESKRRYWVESSYEKERYK